MGEGFVRFKKQNLIDAVVRSLLVCFTAALLVIGAFLILVKQGVFDFEVTYFVLIGVAFGLLLGCATFFVVHLSDVRLARKLDRELSLNEKE